MFKFLKSKKGFTLVELMIVVVIMAILVAVAVPIFSAVTSNARKKTCIGNQREIISSVGNWLMLKPTEKISGTFSTSGGQDNPQWVGDAIKITIDGEEKDVTTEVQGLFKVAPACPNSDANIVVTIIPGETGTDNSKATVKTECKNGAESSGHVVPGLK